MTDPLTTPPDAAPRRSPAGLALRAGAVALVMILSLLGGYIAGKLGQSTAASGVGEADKESEEEDHAAAPAPPPADLSRIDELIEEGRFAQALESCRAYPLVNGAPGPAVSYRRALCLEGLARHAEAMAAFRECTTRSSSEPLRLAGQLGLARAALQRGFVEEARALLGAVLCRSAQPTAAARPYATDALALLALSLADELQPPPPPAPTRPAALARPLPAPQPERYLGWDAPRVPLVQPATWRPTGAVKVTKAGEHPRDWRIEASLAAAPVVELIDRLAAAAGLQPAWSPEARDALLGRVSELACGGAPLDEVLLWLTAPHALAVQITRDAVSLRRAADVPAAELQRLRRAAAGRCLRRALLAASGHPLAGNLYLALGNLEAAAGTTDEAAGWYQRLGRDLPRAAAVSLAMYNLGLLRLEQGQREAARQAFFEAIDRTPGHELTGLCYWWIARSHLDEANTAEARRMLLRALQAGSAPAGKRPAQDGPVQVAATLGLCCALLYEGQPRQAHAALQAARQSVQQAPFVEAAALLDGLARYRLAGDDAKKRAVVLPELLGVLLVPDGDPSWLGPMLPLLRGQAMRQAGLTEEMLALYERQLAVVRGPLAPRYLFEVAEVLAAKGRDVEARARFERLAVPEEREVDAQLAGRARLHLAALDLRAGQPDRCLSRCRSALAGGADRALALSLMGRAYAAKKDYARAARCLAGEVPSP